MALRVATYNLYLGADLSLLFGLPEEGSAEVVAELTRQLEVTDFPTRARAVARLLVDAQVDLVGLQEVTRWERGGVVLCDFREELKAALAETGDDYDVHAVNANFAGTGAEMAIEGSNVILVRRDLRVLEERIGTYAAALTVPTPMGPVRIARSWGWVDVETELGVVRFANTHTEAYDVTVRNAQRDELLEAVGNPDYPVVLVGDFNATPDNVGIPAPYVDAWRAAGHDPNTGHTCGQAADLRNEASTLHERIDYVWVRGAKVEECELLGAKSEERTEGGLWPSDHAGVLAKINS